MKEVSLYVKVKFHFKRLKHDFNVQIWSDVELKTSFNQLWKKFHCPKASVYNQTILFWLSKKFHCKTKAFSHQIFFQHSSLIPRVFPYLSDWWRHKITFYSKQKLQTRFSSVNSWFKLYNPHIFWLILASKKKSSENLENSPPEKKTCFPNRKITVDRLFMNENSFWAISLSWNICCFSSNSRACHSWTLAKAFNDASPNKLFWLQIMSKSL